MRDKIESFIKARPVLYSGYLCAKKELSKDGRQEIIDLQKSPEFIRIKHLGEENYGKVIYIIDPVNSYASGFFSNFTSLLRHLSFTDLYGLEPVVICSENTHYLEQDTSFMNTKNYFDYFFKQPGNVSAESALSSATVVFSERKVVYDFTNRFDAQEGDKEYVRLLQKYIHFNEATQNNLNRAVSTFLGEKRTLGVKFRGTDYGFRFKDHPVPCTPEEVALKTKKVFDKGTYDQIYLATEDITALKYFEKIFGKYLIYDEGMTRYDEKSNHIEAVQNSKYEYPAHQEGLNVLKDVWTLAHTQGLVASPSGVTVFTQFFNKAFSTKEYEEIHIIDKGINKKGTDSIRFFRKIYGK